MLDIHGVYKSIDSRWPVNKGTKLINQGSITGYGGEGGKGGKGTNEQGLHWKINLAHF